MTASTADAVAAFLDELAPTHAACDYDPRVTATDHLVRDLWAAMSPAQRSHLLLRLAWRTRVPRKPLDEPWDEAGDDAYALHQAAAGTASEAAFCGATPDDVAALRHEAADLARLLGTSEDLDETLLVAVLLYAVGRTSPDPDRPPPRGRHRPPRATGQVPWLRSAA